MSTASTKTATSLYQRACKVMPGGVSSPVRAYLSVGGEPPFLASASGNRVTDEAGREYLDFVGSWGPLILGHAHPKVVQAISEAAAKGTSYGAPCLAEIQLAEKVVEASPVADQIRFVNSGTEATMSALRLARGVTGRDLMVKFDGCYHGHGDAFLVKAGSGLATFGESSSQGVPQSVADSTGVLPLNDIPALEQWFEVHGAQTAAVFVEGIPANCGLLPQTKAWWNALSALTKKHGALLVVDEVITGFRLGKGGYCEIAEVEADLVTYGKVIGGGLPVGAYGGRQEYMDLISPQGGVYQAGTLSGNPLCMAAGLAALKVLETENGWTRLEELGAYWENLLQPLMARETADGHPVSLRREASIFWLCFGADTPPLDFAGIPADGAKRYARFFHHLLNAGIMIAPSAYEVGFLNLAMTKQDLEIAADAFGAALEASR